MSSRSVSDIQTRAEGESSVVYQIQIGCECFIVLKNDPSYEFIGEVILRINIV
jgi:hypothetical protein